jgi:glycosyltransferase involved in cell wall biosynthesis
VGERSLKVAFLSPSWPIDKTANGIATYVHGVAAGLRRLGHTPIVLSSHYDEDNLPADFYPLELEELSVLSRIRDGLNFRINAPEALREKFSRVLVKSARRAIEERGVQLLEMEETFGWVQLVKPQLPVPIVARLHGPHFANGAALGIPADDAFRQRVRDEGIGIAQADGLSAPSREILERTREYYGTPLTEAVVIPYPGPVVPAERRWSLADCDRSLILFVGRFDRHKGGDVVIDAFRSIAQRFPKTRLCFVGADEGITDEQGGRWTLSQYIDKRAHDVAGRIDCLGRQPNSSLAELRRKAFVTIVGSRYETFGLVVLEAMAYGSPLVATRTGGIIEIVEDGVNGILARPGDQDDLAAAIARLLDAPEFAAKLSQRAAEDAALRYHPDTIARETAAFFETVLDRWSRSSS